MADPGPVDGGADRAGERTQLEKDFLIRQSMVGELEDFLTPEFLDRVRDRFEARLAERARSADDPDHPDDDPDHPDDDPDHPDDPEAPGASDAPAQ